MSTETPFGKILKLEDQLASLDGIMGLAWRKRERQSRSSIRGNQMNLGVPPSSGFSDGLGSVFFVLPFRPDEL